MFQKATEAIDGSGKLPIRIFIETNRTTPKIKRFGETKRHFWGIIGL
jgi:hypothetical protein